MREERRSPLKIAFAVVALSLLICVFVACKNDPNTLVITKAESQSEITRSLETIYAPIYNETEFRGDATTDPAATKPFATTDPAATKPRTSDPTTTTRRITPSVTRNYTPEEREEISKAAASSGVDAEKIAEFIQVMGYDYDAQDGIFVTSMNNWQRQGNFVSHYDTAARYINMYYRTVTIDFGPYDGLNWRMQLWKGQYGVFGGCEAGIYTADPDANVMVYQAADDYHMLWWESTLYLSKEDYESGNMWFRHHFEEHWWLTGFKSGVVDPEKLIMHLKVQMKTPNMANQFEVALLESGFKKVSSPDSLEYDSFARQLNYFYILWDGLGKLNYSQRTN